MSYTTVLGVVPDRRPVVLAEFQNSWGWSPSIWDRLLTARGETAHWMRNDKGLDRLWADIESLPEWQQAPLVLTFDTGIIPMQAFPWAVEQLDEFERRLPGDPDKVNHVPVMADLLRTGPEVPWIGVWATSVTTNPFDPWDEKADEPGNGLAFDPGVIYVLERHRQFLPKEAT